MICSACRTPFDCDPMSSCWCKTQPRISIDVQDASCYCASCLRRAQALKVNNPDPVLLSTKQREQIMALGTPEKLEAGVDYTIENGLFIFTSWYLLRRGNCCGNGCYNCPYHKAMP